MSSKRSREEAEGKADARSKGDSAGVYFVSIEDFEWRPEPSSGSDSGSSSEQSDAEPLSEAE